MKKLRKIVKECCLKEALICWLVFYMVMGIPAQIAKATPTGGVFQGADTGTIIDGVVDGLNEVMVNQMETVINWESLSTNSEETLQFSQGDLTNAAVLNRVVGENIVRTQFNGTLNAEGMRIFMINPAGIVFGPDAVINVNQLTASSLNIDDADFRNGLPYTFTGGVDAGAVKNYAEDITAEAIALIGREVINQGALLAEELVIMAAGDKVVIREDNGSVVVDVEVAGQNPEYFRVLNVEKGEIEVEGESAQVILAAGDIWSLAMIKASSHGCESDAVSTIDINAEGDVHIGDDVKAEAVGHSEIDAEAAVTINAGGDVDIIAVGDGDAKVEAIARGGYTNTADVLICVDGGLKVKADQGGIANVRALAENGFNNTASVGVGAKGDQGVLVYALNGGEAFIEADAYNGYSNTAETVVCTAGDITVMDKVRGQEARTAGILSEAMGGVKNNAYTGVCADGDVSVLAISLDGIHQCGDSGSHAMIYSEASACGGSGSVAFLSDGFVQNHEPSTTNAQTVVVSKEGGVLVLAGGPRSKAEIHSYAHGGFQNTADTVVCASEDVQVIARADGGRPLAKIKSCAEYGPINTATTRIYANDVEVDVPGLYRGNGIWAYAQGLEVKPHVPAKFRMSAYDGEFGTGEFVWEEEYDGEGHSFGSVTIQEKGTNCPVCPTCPCGGEIPAPVAPLAQFEIPRIEGCPALMLAAAAELGIPSETLQVAIGNSVAMNPSIQPCQACSTLVSAANMLKNEGDARLAAMAQAFNTLAPADAPYTPELAASVATAFATAEEGSQYASAAEYIDALVQYVGVLGDDLGSPVGDSVAYVMEKYGQGITGSDNANLTAFVTTRIEMAQTFAK